MAHWLAKTAGHLDNGDAGTGDRLWGDRSSDEYRITNSDLPPSNLRIDSNST